MGKIFLKKGKGAKFLKRKGKKGFKIILGGKKRGGLIFPPGGVFWKKAKNPKIFHFFWGGVWQKIFGGGQKPNFPLLCFSEEKKPQKNFFFGYWEKEKTPGGVFFGPKKGDFWEKKVKKPKKKDWVLFGVFPPPFFFPGGKPRFFKGFF